MSIIFNNVRVNTSGMFFPGQKVLVGRGKINMVSSNIRKNVGMVVNCDQKFLVPALVDAHSHLGLFDSYDVDLNMAEVYSEVIPHLRPLDGIKMRDAAIADARRAGVSTCLVCPASELPIGGICSILKTNGNSADVGLIVEQAGILASFGRSPKSNAQRNQNSSATTMGIVSVIRELFMRGQDYYEAKQSKKFNRERDITLEALVPLFRKDVPLRVVAARAEDIVAAIRIAEEFDLSMVLHKASEAHVVADMLAEKEIPVVLGPVLSPMDRYEVTEATFESAKILMDKGVEVALTCDFPSLPIETLRVAAAIAVQYGLDERRAFAAITEVPAKILGVSNRIGQIKRGYDADLALFSGHPLDIRSKLDMLLIDGEPFIFSDDLEIERNA